MQGGNYWFLGYDFGRKKWFETENRNVKSTLN